MTRFDETGKEFGGDDVREVTARSIGPRRNGLKISGPGAAACFLRGLLRDEAREPFLALYLNGAHDIVSLSLVSVGGAHSAPVSPREIFPGALLVGACDLRVGHNHTSGDLQPSPEDVTVTRKLKEAGELLRVSLLDHVLFSDTDYVSFHERGILT